MKSYLNIEASGFHRGKYVGYGKMGDVYLISKYYDGWIAYAQDKSVRPSTVQAKTLGEMSEKLRK